MIEDYLYMPSREGTPAMEQTAQFFSGIHRSTGSFDVGSGYPHSKSDENTEKNIKARALPQEKKRNSSSYCNISSNLTEVQSQPGFISNNKDSQKKLEKIQGEQNQDGTNSKQNICTGRNGQFQHLLIKDKNNSKEFKFQMKDSWHMEDQGRINQKRVYSVETLSRVQNQRTSNNCLDSDTLFWSKIGQIVSAPETTIATKINHQNSQQQLFSVPNQQQSLPQQSKQESHRLQQQQPHVKTSCISSIVQDSNNLIQKGLRFFKQQDNLRQSLIGTLPISNNSRTLSSNSTSTSDPPFRLKNSSKMNTFSIQSNQNNGRTPFFNESYKTKNTQISFPTQVSQSQLQQSPLLQQDQSIQSRNQILGKSQIITKKDSHSNNPIMQRSTFLPNFLNSSPNKPLQSILFQNDQNHDARLVPGFSGNQINFEKAKESLKMYDEDKQRNVYKTKQSSSLRGFPVVMSAAAITTTAEYKEQSKENQHQDHEEDIVIDSFLFKKNTLLKTDRRGNTGDLISHPYIGQRALQKRVNERNVVKHKNVSPLSLIKDLNEGEQDGSGVDLFSFCLDQTQEQETKQQPQQQQQFNGNNNLTSSNDDKKNGNFCSNWTEMNQDDTALDYLKIQIDQFQSNFDNKHSSNSNSRSKFNLKCKQQQNVVKKIFNFDNINSPPASANPLNLGASRQILLKNPSERASTQQSQYNYVDKLQLIQSHNR